jgi:geranylgeranyl diphosphate synthase type II
MSDLDNILASVSKRLAEVDHHPGPSGLYEPLSYLLNLGGKRLRPALCLMTCEMFGGNLQNAVAPAAAIELFHNFTLLHDDIMDNAPVRRGHPTAHVKWGSNQAILSGDAMLVMAYKELEKIDGIWFREAMARFSEAALQVCEGQQMDMEFELRDDVSVEEYMEMIRLKTSVLIAATCQLGALVSGVGEEEQLKAYSFGLHMGLSFQLRDDFLDAFGSVDQVGKQQGGDIISDKKTYLLIRTLQRAKGDDQEILKSLIGNKDVKPMEKVASVKRIMKSLGVDEELMALSQSHYKQALDQIHSMNAEKSKKEPLLRLCERLLVREH